MEVISYRAISEFKAKRPDSGKALDRWYNVVSQSQCRNFAELKRVFGSADYVNPNVVFNIGGNKYRLIALVNFRTQTVLIEHILTHGEYDKGKWR